MRTGEDVNLLPVAPSINDVNFDITYVYISCSIQA